VTHWQETIVRNLITAGMFGLSQTVVSRLVHNHVESPEVTNYLESLRAEGAVQRFRVDGAVHWRATQEIYNVV